MTAQTKLAQVAVKHGVRHGFFHGRGGGNFVAGILGAPAHIRVTVTGFNTTGVTAMLCAYMDGAADGVINGTFDRSMDYSVGDGEVGLGTVRELPGGTPCRF